MSHKRILLVTLFCASVAAIGGIMAGRLRSVSTLAQAPAKIGSPLWIDPAALDFGMAWETDRFELQLALENRSSTQEDIELSGSCSCLSVEPSRVSLKPGELAQVHVALDLTPQSGEFTGGGGGFETTLMAITTSRKEAGRWTIHGTVRSVLGTLPKHLTCGPISDSAISAESTYLEITPGILLSGLDVTLNPLLATIEVKLSKETGKLQVAIRPSLPVFAGERSAILRLQPKGQNGEQLPERQIVLIIQGSSDVQPVPGRFLLGAVAEGTTETTEVGFRSLTGKAFTVEPSMPTAPGIVSIERRDGTNPSFAITVMGRGGSQVVPVDFLVHQPNREAYKVRFEVVYHGKK